MQEMVSLVANKSGFVFFFFFLVVFKISIRQIYREKEREIFCSLVYSPVG